jgi:hypothetical protein
MKKTAYTLLLIVLSIGFFHNTANALTISPAKIEITGDPGSVLTGEIEIFNEQEETKIFYTSYENFEPRGDSGAPYFVGGDVGLATWIETQSEVTLAPGERAVVPYKMTIPQDAKAGGYFAAIFFGNQPASTTGGGEVTIGGKIGALVLLRVSGEIEEKGGLISFIANKRFFSSTPVNFEYTLNNLGGDRIVPQGELKIKNSFWLTSATLLANKNEGSVLPNSSRKFEVAWTDEDESVKKKKSEDVVEEKLNFFGMAGKQLKDFHFGFYTAKLNVTWGETSQTDKDSFVFFIIPWQLLTIVLFIIIILGLASKRFIRKYNRWIIAQAQMTQRVRSFDDKHEERPIRRRVASETAVKKPTVKKRVIRKKDE